MASQALPLDKSSSFVSLGLDTRVIDAIARFSIRVPSEAQALSLKLAITGKDVLLMSPCRTGRTTALAIAAVDKILKSMDTLNYTSGLKALCVGPTRDSCERLYQALALVAHFCGDAFKVAHLSDQTCNQADHHHAPEVLVGTPGRLLQHLEAGALSTCSSMHMLLLDDADRLVTFEGMDDLRYLTGQIQAQGYQTIVTAAHDSDQLTELLQWLSIDPSVLLLSRTAPHNRASKSRIKSSWGLAGGAPPPVASTIVTSKPSQSVNLSKPKPPRRPKTAGTTRPSSSNGPKSVRARPSTAGPARAASASRSRAASTSRACPRASCHARADRTNNGGSMARKFSLPPRGAGGAPKPEPGQSSNSEELLSTVYDSAVRCATLVGSDLWTARRDGWINIRSSSGGRLMNSVVTDDAMVMCLEYVPQHAATGRVWAGTDGGKILVFNSLKACLIKTLVHHTGAVRSIVVEHTRKHVFSGGADFHVVQSTLEGALVRRFVGHTNTVRGVLPLGFETWSAADDGSVRVWDEGGHPTSAQLNAHEGAAVALCNTGHNIWSGGDDGVIKVWTLLTAGRTECERSFKLDSGQPVKHLCIMGQHVWCTGNTPYIYVLDAVSSELIKTLSGHTGFINELCKVQQSDSRLVWTYSLSDTTMRCWEQKLAYDVDSGDSLVQARSQNTVFRQLVRELEEELALTRQKLQDCSSRSSTAHADMVERNDSLTSQIIKLQQENLELTTQLKLVSTRLHSADQEAAMLRDQVEASQLQLSDQEADSCSQAEQFKHQMVLSNANLKRLDTELAELRLNETRLVREVSGLEAEKEQSRKESRQTATLISRLRAQLNGLEEQLKREKLPEMHVSTDNKVEQQKEFVALKQELGSVQAELRDVRDVATDKTRKHDGLMAEHQKLINASNQLKDTISQLENESMKAQQRAEKAETFCNELKSQVSSQGVQIQELLQNTKLVDIHRLEKVARELKVLQDQLKSNLTKYKMFDTQHMSTIQLQFKTDRAIIDMFFSGLCSGTQQLIEDVTKIIHSSLREVQKYHIGVPSKPVE